MTNGYEDLKGIIHKKELGLELSGQELSLIIDSCHRERSLDEIMNIFLALVKEKGLSLDETAHLTTAMANTGERISWQEAGLASKIKIDLPSSGGVGNKTPLIVPPIVAAVSDRLIIPKMSSRGGTFGTIDILDSIHYRSDLSIAEYIEIIRTIGLSNICQTKDLAPIDGRMMELRRKSDTMDVKALVISSILCKKIATGCDHLVIDIKAGNDSKFGGIQETYAAGQEFVDVGKRLGMKIVCVLTENDVPQGRYIGNALSLVEVLDVLNGRGPQDQRDLCLYLAGEMLALSGVAKSTSEGIREAKEALDSGRALRKFKEQMERHGAEMTKIEKPELLANAQHKLEIQSPSRGYICEMNVEKIKKCAKAVILKEGKVYHYSAGIVLRKGYAEWVEAGETIAEIHTNDLTSIEHIRRELVSAFSFTPNPFAKKSLILGRVSETGVELNS